MPTQGQGEQKSSPFKNLSQDILDAIDDGKALKGKNIPPKINFDSKIKHNLPKNGILESSSSEV